MFENMFKNHFLTLLFDPRGKISRWEFGGCILFLLLILSFNASLLSWSTFRNQFFDFAFIDDAVSELHNVYYLLSLFSLICIVKKRCTTLGYSNQLSVAFVISNLVMYLSLLQSIKIVLVRYDYHGISWTPDMNIAGVFTLIGIISLIVLSKKNEYDHTQSDLDTYHSIRVIYRVFYISFVYGLVLILIKNLANDTDIILILFYLTIFVIVSAIYTISLLRIYIIRAKEVNAPTRIVVISCILTILAILYIVLENHDPSALPEVIFFFIQITCAFIFNIYLLYRIYLISLPTQNGKKTTITTTYD